MQVTPEHNERMAKLTFGSVYPMYVNKVVGKNRTEAELNQVIEWLTGYNKAELKELAAKGVTFNEFFDGARLHPSSRLITGTICGYKIQDITNTLTKQVRYLDMLVDELAQGKTMDKILRKEK